MLLIVGQKEKKAWYYCRWIGRFHNIHCRILSIRGLTLINLFFQEPWLTLTFFCQIWLMYISKSTRQSISVCRFVCTFAYSSSGRQFVSLPAYIIVCGSVYLFLYFVCVCLSACIYLSVSLSVCQFVLLSDWLFVCYFAYVSVNHSICPSVYLSVFLLVCLCAYLSVFIFDTFYLHYLSIILTDTSKKIALR